MVVALLVILGFSIYTCNKKNVDVKPPDIQYIRDTIRDTISHDTIIYRDKMVPSKSTHNPKSDKIIADLKKLNLQKDSFVSVVLEETTSTLEKYYKYNTYDEYYSFGKFGYLQVQDTISENQIISRRLIPNLREFVTTIRDTIKINTTPPLKNKWFIGGGAGLSKNELLNDVNVGIGVLTKKQQLYELKLRSDFKGNKVLELNTFIKL